MEEIVAFCGLLCHECGAFLATKDNDDKKRALVAELWSKEYNVKLKPEDIHCTGCISEGENIFSHCKVCEIRKCGKDKSLVNCAHCNDYACEKLDKFLLMVPECRKRLDTLRSTLI